MTQSVTNAVPLAAEDDLWLAAAADVSAAVVGERVREESLGGTPVSREEALFIEGACRSFIPTARRAFVAGHPRHEGPCHCRHESIIIVAASCEAKMTGTCYADLVVGSLAVLAAYFERRS